MKRIHILAFILGLTLFSSIAFSQWSGRIDLYRVSRPYGPGFRTYDSNILVGSYYRRGFEVEKAYSAKLDGRNVLKNMLNDYCSFGYEPLQYTDYVGEIRVRFAFANSGGSKGMPLSRREGPSTRYMEIAYPFAVRIDSDFEVEFERGEAVREVPVTTPMNILLGFNHRSRSASEYEIESGFVVDYLIAEGNVIDESYDWNVNLSILPNVAGGTIDDSMSNIDFDVKGIAFNLKKEWIKKIFEQNNLWSDPLDRMTQTEIGNFLDGISDELLSTINNNVYSFVLEEYPTSNYKPIYVSKPTDLATKCSDRLCIGVVLEEYETGYY